MIRHSTWLIGAVFSVCLLVLPTCTQTVAWSATDQQGFSSFLSHWVERVHRAQLNQPDWLTPVVTSTARLKQEVRYDMSWQWNEDGTRTDNYGGSKGFSTIPINRIEISIILPPNEFSPP